MLNEYSIKLNGDKETFKAMEDMPLLWVLRDLLDKKGTKFGCGVGQCGSCTVLVNGEATKSCSVTAKDVNGSKVTTIEGLSDEGDHPLQKAWAKLNVPQCGYCQPGQIMRAAGLFNEKKRPTDTEIDEAMDDNICRCGTYQRIKKAIKLVASGEIS